jgi:hypothetical protein
MIAGSLLCTVALLCPHSLWPLYSLYFTAARALNLARFDRRAAVQTSKNIDLVKTCLAQAVFISRAEYRRKTKDLSTTCRRPAVSSDYEPPPIIDNLVLGPHLPASPLEFLGDEKIPGLDSLPRVSKMNHLRGLGSGRSFSTQEGHRGVSKVSETGEEIQTELKALWP